MFSYSNQYVTETRLSFWVLPVIHFINRKSYLSSLRTFIYKPLVDVLFIISFDVRTHFKGYLSHTLLLQTADLRRTSHHYRFPSSWSCSSCPSHIGHRFSIPFITNFFSPIYFRYTVKPTNHYFCNTVFKLSHLTKMISSYVTVHRHGTYYILFVSTLLNNLNSYFGHQSLIQFSWLCKTPYLVFITLSITWYIVSLVGM